MTENNPLERITTDPESRSFCEKAKWAAKKLGLFSTGAGLALTVGLGVTHYSHINEDAWYAIDDPSKAAALGTACTLAGTSAAVLGHKVGSVAKYVARKLWNFFSGKNLEETLEEYDKKSRLKKRAWNGIQIGCRNLVTLGAIGGFFVTGYLNYHKKLPQGYENVGYVAGVVYRFIAETSPEQFDVWKKQAEENIFFTRYFVVGSPLDKSGKPPTVEEWINGFNPEYFEKLVGTLEEREQAIKNPGAYNKFKHWKLYMPSPDIFDDELGEWNGRKTILGREIKTFFKSKWYKENREDLSKCFKEVFGEPWFEKVIEDYRNAGSSYRMEENYEGLRKKRENEEIIIPYLWWREGIPMREMYWFVNGNLAYHFLRSCSESESVIAHFFPESIEERGDRLPYFGKPFFVYEDDELGFIYYDGKVIAPAFFSKNGRKQKILGDHPDHDSKFIQIDMVEEGYCVSVEDYEDPKIVVKLNDTHIFGSPIQLPKTATKTPKRFLRGFIDGGIITNEETQSPWLPYLDIEYTVEHKSGNVKVYETISFSGEKTAITLSDPNTSSRYGGHHHTLLDKSLQASEKEFLSEKGSCECEYSSLLDTMDGCSSKTTIIE